MSTKFNNDYLDEMYYRIYDPEKTQQIKNEYVAKELYRLIMIEEAIPENRKEIINIFLKMCNI